MKHLFFLLLLGACTLSGCEKDSFVPSLNEHLDASTVTVRADDCSYDASTNRVIPFEICGADLVYQGELRLVNHGNIHRIQAIAKCHKADDPDAPVAITEIAIEIFGSIHIDCSIPLDVPVPSDYNANLDMGAVTTNAMCDNCWKETIDIEYLKLISLKQGDVVKGKFRFKLDVYGELSEEEFVLTLTP